MRDALGGTVTITIIVVFIVLVLSYLAFNVNYTKTFRMKDKVISCYNACATDKEKRSKGCTEYCRQEISNYARTIGYDQNIECDGGNNWEKSPDGYYCYKEVPVTEGVNRKDTDYFTDRGVKVYYRIKAKIKTDLPIIKNIFRMFHLDDSAVFSIEGQTNAYYK